MLGCLAAGFWLLRVFDMTVASYVAGAGINVYVALLALFVLTADVPIAAAPIPGLRGVVKSSRAPCYRAFHERFPALGAEVVRTRLLSRSIRSALRSTRSSIILAVFLIGMGIGSGIGTMIAKRARTALGISQLLLIPAIAWAGYMIANQLPYWDKNLSVHADPWHGFLFDFGCCALALLPATLLWGASFPLALNAAAQSGGDSARTVGAIYAANTMGAILGAIAFSIFAVPLLGSQNSRTRARAQPPRLLALSSHLARNGDLPRSRPPPHWRSLAWLTPPVPWQLLAFGRRMPMEAGHTGNGWKRLYSAEGVNSSIAYTRCGSIRPATSMSPGKVEASQYSQRAAGNCSSVLGHLPRAAASRPTAHPDRRLRRWRHRRISFVVHPEVERITLCEIRAAYPSCQRPAPSPTKITT